MCSDLFGCFPRRCQIYDLSSESLYHQQIILFFILIINKSILKLHCFVVQCIKLTNASFPIQVTDLVSINCLSHWNNFSYPTQSHVFFELYRPTCFKFRTINAWEWSNNRVNSWKLQFAFWQASGSTLCYIEELIYTSQGCRTHSLGGVCEMHTSQGGVPPKDVVHTVSLGGVCEMHTSQGGVPPKDVVHTVSLGGVCEMHTPQGGVPPKDGIHTVNLRRSVWNAHTPRRSSSQGWHTHS